MNDIQERRLDWEFVNECIEYNPKTGEARWRVRPESHFATKPAQKACNSRHAGSRIGIFSGLEHGPRVTINGVVYQAAQIVYFLDTGVWANIVVCKNGDCTDLRFDNLVPCTRHQGRWYWSRLGPQPAALLSQKPSLTFAVTTLFVFCKYQACFSKRQEADARKFGDRVSREGVAYIQAQDPEHLNDDGLTRVFKRLFSNPLQEETQSS